LRAWRTTASTAGGSEPPATAGSTLTNSDATVPRPAAIAPSRALRRQAHSRCGSRPDRWAASKRAAGDSSGPFGPRASASKATVSPVARSTMGWYAARTVRRSRIRSSIRLALAGLSAGASTTDIPVPSTAPARC
jgi:hypothetical protein